MRRKWLRAAVCAMVIWFGLFEFGTGGPAAYKGDMLRELDKVEAKSAPTIFSVSEKEPLLASAITYANGQMAGQNNQLSYEVDGPLESNKSINGNSDEQNNRIETKLSKGKEKIVYLTFDDGPSKNTEQVLKILEKENIKATFFVLGEQVLKQPKLSKQIVEAGHFIGNHTFNHKYASVYGSFAEFSNQVMKTDEAIYETVGVKTNLFRAPGGTYRNFDQGYFNAMAAAGYQVHDWNVDSGDSKRKNVPASEILTTIKGSSLVNKLVVLLHDGTGHEESVKALPAIIKYYRGKGYSFAPLTEKIEPIQFRVADSLKWDRAKVTDKQAEQLALFSEKLSEKALLAGKEKELPSLILHRGEGKLELKPDEYRLNKGAIEVSKLRLTEWISELAELKVTEPVIPIRATLQKIGISITSFVYNDQQREIWLT